MVGKKCYLSVINIEDYEKYTKWVNDMEVAIGMIFSAGLITPIQERHILEGLSNTDFNFAIADLESDELIGNVGFPKIDCIPRRWNEPMFI